VSQAVPFLELDGVEVGNAARVLSYIRRGLAGSSWITQEPCGCGVLDAEGGGQFLNPMLDQAPWIDSDRPESFEFLGVIPDIKDGLDGVVSRDVTQRGGGLGGGAVSAEIIKPRGFEVTATLVASSERGLAYGKRWLVSRLAPERRDQALQTARLRLWCPPSVPEDPTPTAGEYLAYDVALTEGPDQEDQFGFSERVTFVLTAANGHLYHRPRQGMEERQLNFDAGLCPRECFVLNPPNALGRVGVIITIYSGRQDLRNLVVGRFSARTRTALTTGPNLLTGADVLTSSEAATFLARTTSQTLASSGTLTTSGGTTSTDPEAAVKFNTIPASSTLVYDSARRMVTIRRPDGSVADATGYVKTEETEAIEWFEVEPTDVLQQLCFYFDPTCDATSQASIRIDTQTRER
jgi:hypothetical protein